MSDSGDTADRAEGSGLGVGSAGDRDAARPSDSTKVGKERRGNPVSRRVRSIVTYYRQVVAELRKVIWPTRRELVTYTAVVLVFVVFMVAVVSLYDFGASQAVLKVFGDG